MRQLTSTRSWAGPLRITLRAGAILCVFLAVAFSLLGNECWRAWRQANALATLAPDEVEFSPRGTIRSTLRGWLPNQLQVSLGETFFSRVIGVSLYHGISDEELAECEKLEDLRWITISGIDETTPYGWSHLRNLSCLRSLQVRVDLASQYTVVSILHLEQLESLEVHIETCGTALSSLERLHQLRYLDLNFSLKDSDDDYFSSQLRHARFPSSLSRLQIGVGDSSRTLTSELGDAFITFDRLEHLSLAGTVSGGARSGIDSEALNVIARLKNLMFLDLNHTSIDDSALYALAPLEHLQSINVQGTDVTSKGVRWLAESLPSLKSIEHSVGLTVDQEGELKLILAKRDQRCARQINDTEGGPTGQ